MSLAMTLLSLLSAWVSVALALLWGVMRIVRRHNVGEPVGHKLRIVRRPLQPQRPPLVPAGF